MIPRNSDLPFVFLKPAEMYFTNQPTLLATILGSCVAATMFNRSSGLAALCHGLLPVCNKRQDDCVYDCVGCSRYVGCSLSCMLATFAQNKIPKSEIEVKLFGGSEMFDPQSGYETIKSVGKQNIEIAMKIIKIEGLNLIASDLGGPVGRKIYFYTNSGEVLLKRLKKQTQLV